MDDWLERGWCRWGTRVLIQDRTLGESTFWMWGESYGGTVGYYSLPSKEEIALFHNRMLCFIKWRKRVGADTTINYLRFTYPSQYDTIIGTTATKQSNQHQTIMRLSSWANAEGIHHRRVGKRTNLPTWPICNIFGTEHQMYRGSYTEFVAI